MEEMPRNCKRMTAVECIYILYQHNVTLFTKGTVSWRNVAAVCRNLKVRIIVGF